MSEVMCKTCGQWFQLGQAKHDCPGLLPRSDAVSNDVVERVTLAQCPIGLFWCLGELCLKTEYGNNEGRIDAYIVSSGEFFWGEAPQSIANQRAQLVQPIDTNRAFAAISAYNGEG